MHYLRELYCKNNVVHTINISIDAYYNYLDRLEHVDLSNNLIEKHTISARKFLKHLDISKNKISSISFNSSTIALQKLFIEENLITSIYIELPHLQVLSMHNNNIGTITIADSGFGNLQRITLQNNNIPSTFYLNLLKKLPTLAGQCVLYQDGDDNFKDFSGQDIAQCLKDAKEKGWKFYKNDFAEENLL